MPYIASSNHEELQNDLGIFIQANKPVEDVITTISRMSDGQKYHLLKSHDRPSHHYTFPIRLVGGTMRSFRLQWLDEHAWLVYSRKIDGAFCVCCALFANRKDRKRMGIMVNTPFIKWHHKSEIVGKHSSKPSHTAAFQEAEIFIQNLENPKLSVSVQLDKKRQL